MTPEHAMAEKLERISRMDCNIAAIDRALGSTRSGRIIPPAMPNPRDFINRTP